MKLPVLCFALLVFFPPFQKSLPAQTPSCGTDLLFQKKCATDPTFQEKHRQADAQAFDFFKKNSPDARRGNAVTIPVVVHVVHDGGSENLPDAVILTGIQQLNDAFANLGYYAQGSGTNTMIQFCLAKRTPDGLATNGITRDQNALTMMTMETDDIVLKNLNRWKPTEYVNIWLVREINSVSSGGGVAGYAYFPSSHGGPEDGIVMEARWFGSSPANTGVLAHEMGHYLGLYHTFEGGCKNDDCLADGDRVCDTPPDQSTLWTPCSAQPNTCSTESPDLPDMIQNFMDYTDFQCFHDFTAGQSGRMDFFINGRRTSLLDSRGCLDPCPNPPSVTCSANPTKVNVGGTVNFSSTASNAGSLVWKVNGLQFATGPTASRQFTTEGVFTITVVATHSNSALCGSDSCSVQVQVVCPVKADFSVSNAAPVPGETVIVSNQSQNATQFEWFVDGISQGANLTSFTFPSPGVHSIRVVAGNGFCERSKIIFLAVAKQDSCETTWVKTFGRPGQNDGLTGVFQAKDGNFWLNGYLGDSTLIGKMTPGGTMLLLRKFKFSQGAEERMSEMFEDSDGNLVGCGIFTNGVILGFAFKYDPAADKVLWAWNNPPFPQTFYFSIIEKSPGGNYLAVNSYHDSPSPGSADDLHLVEIDRTTGTLLPNMNNGYSFGSSDGAIELKRLGDRLYTSGRYSYGAGFELMRSSVSCFDLSGNEIWSRMAFYDASSIARNYAVDFVFEGNSMVVLTTGDFSGSNFTSNRFAVSKNDLDGNLLWGKIYELPPGTFVFAKSIISVSDGYVVLVSQYEFLFKTFLIKIDKNGDLVWSQQFDDLRVFRGEKLLAEQDGYLYFGGEFLGDLALVKVNASDGSIGVDCPTAQPTTLAVQNAPNFFEKINLTRYPSPLEHIGGMKTVTPVMLPENEVCKQECSDELCNNGLDDDGDNLFDCLDPDCECLDCDGKQANIWYFGDHTGLDWTTDPPTQLTDGQSFGYEASAVACDMLGNLLFYTDGQRVFNRQHALMPNGSGLVGHHSTTQMVILPQPGKPWRFYVFTPNSFDNTFSGQGLGYSVVDMSLAGGFGDVDPSFKNISLVSVDNFTEKIAATRHCNGVDWWVVVKERPGNTFRIYLLTINGLGTPTTFNGGVSANMNNVISVLKFSPDGKHLANMLFSDSGFDFFDFDNSTGQMTYVRTVSNPATMFGAYGAEFSPDGKLLYVSALRAPSHLVQVDLEKALANPSDGIFVLAEDPSEYRYGQIQRAPNDKLIVTNTFASTFTQTLGIIHEPNLVGAACQYQHEGLALTAGGANLGLPSYPQDFLPKKIFVEISGPDSICGVPQDLDFQLNKLDCAADSVVWKLTGGTILSSSKTGARVRFSAVGTAVLIATAYSKCAVAADTFLIEIFDESAPTLDLGADFSICENGVVTLDAGAGFQKYRWNNGSAEQTLTATAPGKYWVEVWGACGETQSDTLIIKVLPPTVLDLGDNRVACAGTVFTFNLPSQFSSWQWLPDDNLNCDDCSPVNATVSGTTTYIVIGKTSEGCLSADTISLVAATDTIFAVFDTSICRGDLLPVFGATLPADTVAVFAFTTPGGCDSVVTVTVLGIDPIMTVVDGVFCAGDTLIFNGLEITRDTVVVFNFTSSAGCDSTVMLDVEVLDTALVQLDLAACPGESVVFQNEKIPVGTSRAFIFKNQNTGCDSTVVVRAMATSGPSVDIAASDSLVLGDSLRLNPVASGTPPLAWVWLPSDALSCSDCPNPVARPLENTVFSVTVTDANGCTSRDSISLLVTDCEGPYVPNAFTPNGDGVNDHFYIFGKSCIRTIKFLRIYDRWGELVFERLDFAPNDESLGWNGRFRNRDFPSEVLVWLAEVEFVDGAVRPMEGDLTLIR